MDHCIRIKRYIYIYVSYGALYVLLHVWQRFLRIWYQKVDVLLMFYFGFIWFLLKH